LQALSKPLPLSNPELETFSYTTSHRLPAPSPLTLILFPNHSWCCEMGGTSPFFCSVRHPVDSQRERGVPLSNGLASLPFFLPYFCLRETFMRFSVSSPGPCTKKTSFPLEVAPTGLLLPTSFENNNLYLRLTSVFRPNWSPLYSWLHPRSLLMGICLQP